MEKLGMDVALEPVVNVMYAQSMTDRILQLLRRFD